jgi:hypothetical protein
VSLTATGVIRRFPRIPAIVGAAAVVIIAVGVAVVASGDDDGAIKTATPVTAAVTVATEVISSTDLSAAAVTSIAPTTLAPAVVATTEQSASTSAATPPPPSSSSCVVGSWLADNDAFLAAMTEAAAGLPIKWDAVTGALRLDIGLDGSVVTTYDNWTQTSTLGGAGTALVSVIGVDTSTIAFADDGTYSVSATQIGSQTQLSASGVVLRAGPSQDALLGGAATYTCSGDRLDIVSSVATDMMGELTLVFTRSG